MDIQAECDEAIKRIHTYVDFLAKDKIDWNGHMPLYSKTFDIMFFCVDDIFDFCYDYNLRPEYLCLYTCVPTRLKNIPMSCLKPEAYKVVVDVPLHIRSMVSALNLIINECDPVGYKSTDIAVSI